MRIGKIDFDNAESYAMIGKFTILPDQEEGFGRAYARHNVTGEVFVINVLQIIHDALKKESE